jgi:tRNA threonylcarbamoyl adenosine modification protein YeaZ
MALTLAIEISNPTSGPRGRITTVRGETLDAGPGVALARAPGEYLGTEPLHDGANHDDDLMPAVDRLFARFGATPRDLSRVAVSAGPGGYTALRIAVATAKMLAHATDATTVAVPSAAVAAWSHRAGPFPLLVCLASKADTTFAALFLNERSDAPPATPGLIRAPDLERLKPAAIVADTYLPDAIRQAADTAGIAVLEPVFSARAVLDLAASFPVVDAAALSPIYPREPEAVSLWAKRGA